MEAILPRTNAISAAWIGAACLFSSVLGNAADSVTAVPSLGFATSRIEFRLQPATGACSLRDKRTGVLWQSASGAPRFGELTLRTGGGSPRRIELKACETRRFRQGIEAVFRPLAANREAALRVRIEPASTAAAIECSYTADAALEIESMRWFEGLFEMGAPEAGYLVVPVREGLLIPADSGRAFSHRFDTYAYEGCHMAMLGAVKRGATALLTWDDPYVAVEVSSALENGPGTARFQRLAASLVLRKSARSMRVQVCEPGGYNEVASAYRQVAKDKGWWTSWDRKLAADARRSRLFGAANFKLWSVLDRQMNADSSVEQSVRVNWTFAEAAQVAVHLKRDLDLDRVLFLMGGWIRRGYDNQHPDILPAAPECGGDAGLAECARRVRELGYVFGLHDNYQDMYRDAPSWSEDWIMKTPAGELAKGGQWAGGRAYLICSKRALELARRPQNLAAARALTRADAYFIDTTYAAGLQECFDPSHPLDRRDDLHWKQALSDEARGLFGIFGSECGREWAIPHSDFFEGLAGVSGRHFHDAALEAKLGGTSIPLFELVYRECIALYGKYGYNPAEAAAYVLHHVVLGRPLHYHNIPPHLYWKEPAQHTEPVAARPEVARFESTQARSFRIAYRWSVERTPSADWRVFVHFTDQANTIRFQNDHAPSPPTSRWAPGKIALGPFDLALPVELTGRLAVRMGLYQADGGTRATLPGGDPDERSCLVGYLNIGAAGVTFEPGAREEPADPGDPALFMRGDNGWTAGMHPLDRFLKNTHEILGPLNQLTARLPLSRHDFLTPDRLVQRSRFGHGRARIEAVVNGSPRPYAFDSSRHGHVILPPYGFAVDAPGFAAFHASAWGGHRYQPSALFTLRSLDDRPLDRSNAIRVFHGFGDDRLAWDGRIEAIAREQVLTTRLRARHPGGD